MTYGWDLLVFVAALSVAAFTPGPGLAAIVAAAIAQGARKTVWFCAGVIAGDLALAEKSPSGLPHAFNSRIPAIEPAPNGECQHIQNMG